MNHYNSSTIQKALDCIEELLPEEQETLIEIIRRRNIEKRRNGISRNAADTLNAIKEGKASYGSVEDLKKDLATGIL